VAKEYNIPKEQALRVFELKEVAQQQADQVRANNTLSPDQRQAALQGIRTETERAVGGVLGQDATKAYVERGSWIQSLDRPEAR
jgi:hypothetical protein